MKIQAFFMLISVFLASFNSQADTQIQTNLPHAGKKILYIDSYHKGYAWSDGITQGIKNVLLPSIIKNLSDQTPNPTDIQLKIVHMDTKRQTAKTSIQLAALKVKAEIEQYKPDVVIASDDNASKYLIVPFYKNADLPFVFCGVNAKASEYGYPFQNVTGMFEIDLANQILKHLKKYAKGERLGFLAADTLSTHKIMASYDRLFGIKFTQTYFVKDFAAWKQAYLDAQKEVDMLFILNYAGIANWDEAKAKAFAEANMTIPTGTPHEWQMSYTLLGITKIPQEQGVWAAQTALKILNGAKPIDIPMTTNNQGRLVLNLRLAEKLGIAFKPSLLKLADIVR